MYFELVPVCVRPCARTCVLWLLGWVGAQSTWSYIPDHMTPEEQAVPVGGQLDLWISHWVGDTLISRVMGRMTDGQWLILDQPASREGVGR